MRLNDLPGIDGLEKGDLLDVTLKKSNRVRKGCRGKTYRVVFERVGLIDVTDNTGAVNDGVPLEEVIASKKHDGGWVLEGWMWTENDDDDAWRDPGSPELPVGASSGDGRPGLATDRRGILQGFHSWSIKSVERA